MGSVMFMLPVCAFRYADDTSSFVVDSSPVSLRQWLQQRTDGLCSLVLKVAINSLLDKSAVMVFRSRKMPTIHFNISVASATIPQVSSHCHLGVIFNDTLTWSDHVTHVISKASAKIGFLRWLSKRLDALVLRELFLCCIRPAIEYASIVWSGLSASDIKRLERCNWSAARLIARISPSADVSQEHLLAHAGIQSLQKRREAAQSMFCCRGLAGCLPAHLQSAVSAWLPG